MSELSIRLIYNLETGKKDVIIDFISDIDTLPIEHENAHKQAIEALLGKGILRPDELGEVTVTRQRPQRAPAQETPVTPARAVAGASR
jgi:hypothetical protein